MLLEQVKNVNFTDEELEAEYEEVLESFNTIMAQLNEDVGMDYGTPASQSGREIPSPGMADDSTRTQAFPEDDEVNVALENAVKQMVAVKKAMVILNKMPDSASRTRNKSRVMGNLNRIRGSLQRIVKSMQDTDTEQGFPQQ